MASQVMTAEVQQEYSIDPYLPHADRIVLQNLLHTVQHDDGQSRLDIETSEKLKAINDPTHPEFEPLVLAMYDEEHLPAWINRYLLRPYYHAAKGVVRHPSDVVFLTHILWNSLLTLPSAIVLMYRFTYIHAIIHAAHAIWCAGPFTLMMHNHIHNHGVLAKKYRWFDAIFPYVLEPLLGHTWDTYYYHHVKHHHVEGNGPEDLSTTIRYQRDEVWSFVQYQARFLFLIWYDLPRYFLQKRQPGLAVRAAISELASYAFIYCMAAYVNTRATIFTMIIPLCFMRIAVMWGNWGQHCLVDEIEPDHDLRSSITLIDVTSNRLCFNDGWHTAHHLNPRRHWRDHHLHFIKNKTLYANGHALIFRDIDYFMLTFKVLSKDYMYLAERVVPIGDQVHMSKTEIAAMLRTKTRKFTEEDIRQKFKQAKDK